MDSALTTLSSVRTIMGMVQDILSAADTASRSKSRCDKVAERVRCLRDMLEAAQLHDDDGTTTDAATTRRLLDRLEEALGRMLQAVRRCQRGGSFLRSVVAAAAGGRMADPLGLLDEARDEVDRCVLDLALANSFRVIARLQETPLLVVGREQRSDDVAAAAGTEEDGGEKKEEEVGHEGTTATTNDEEITAVGVPVCTANAAAAHEHDMMVPPPCYGYGYYGCMSHRHSYRRNHHHGCAASNCWYDHHYHNDHYEYYHTQYSSPYPSMFSDDNPNSCTIL